MSLKLKSILGNMKVILKRGLKEDVSDSKTGQYLMLKGFIGKNGKTTKKGKKALKLLK
jgi:hypothetical protein